MFHMLKECNESELSALMSEHPEAVFYRVCRKPLFQKGIKSAFPVLAPSKELHLDYQKGRITWEEYEKRYIQQIIESEKAQSLIAKIKKEGETTDVYFVCVCGREQGEQCHRFILLGGVLNGF
jgi:uncharacterized protein YeaO (DUF488 family)